MSAGLFELLTGSSTPLLASGDVVCFVDVSDTTQAAQGSLVKATQTQFFAALNVPVVVTSASAGAFAVGLSGTTNSAFKVDASTALQVAGLTVTGAVTGGTVAVVVTDSGAAANFTLNAKGTGTIGIGSVSTGRVTITPVTTITGALTLSAALTYGGVTLSNAVTGTGNMVLSASPTFTGTIVSAGITASADFTNTHAYVSTGAVQSNSASKVVLDYNSGGRVTGFGVDASTLGSVEINVVKSDGSTRTAVGTFTSTGLSLNTLALSGVTTLSGSGAVSGFTTAVFSTSVSTPILTSAVGADLVLKTGTAGTVATFTSATGNLTFGGIALSGIAGLTVASGTTAVQALTAAGTITSTVTADAVFTNTAASTSRKYSLIQNTGGYVIMGVESSTGGSLITGTAAYGSIIGSNNATPLYIISNSTIAATVSTAQAWAFAAGISCTTVTASTSAKTASGATSVATATLVNLFAPPSPGVYLMFMYDAANSALASTAVVMVDGSGLVTLSNLINAGTASLSVNGSSVAGSHTAGSTKTMNWSYLRVN